MPYSAMNDVKTYYEVYANFDRYVKLFQDTFGSK
jgi:hypothetical protein